MKDAVIGLTLDRSGSMMSMWDEAVAGYNSFKQEQASNDGKTWLITTYFDHEIKPGYTGKDIKQVPDLSPKDDEVYPRGMTALVDATLATIKATKAWLKNNPGFDGKVYQVIITDGYENASEASPAALRSEVGDLEDEGWEFIYLAANVDLDATRRQYGFVGGQSISYTPDAVVAAYSATSSAVTRSRQGADIRFTDKDRQKSKTA